MHKILHIITRLDRGGSAENTLVTCLGLAEKYELVLVHGLSLESRMTDWEKQSVDSRIKGAMERGVKVIPFPSLVRRISPLQDLRAMFSLCRLIMREKPDMIHTHTSKAGILGRCAAWLARVPIILHTAHGHVFYGHFGPSASTFFVLLERLMALITDRMIALTQGERNDYIKSSVSRPDRIVTIHSGVDIYDYMSARVNIEEKIKSLGISTKGLVVGTVGWLLPIKGPMHLLNAMESVWQGYPEATLVFVGKGDLEAELRARALEMGASDRVKFLGWRDDIPEIMQILDVFALPSLNEGMGRVLVEAMAAGKPVVASRVGGVPDLIKHGENGFLVGPGDENGLSVAILKLLADKSMRNQMGEKGRIMAREFSVENMIEKIDVLYDSLFSETVG